MGPAVARSRLVHQLRRAYSGELAAAHAYRGHAGSVRDPAERDALAAIEADELHHRAAVGAMLAELGSGPSGARELVFDALGRLIGLLCHLTGWLAPMYGAGLLESRNIGEYEDAARTAVEAGLEALAPALLVMAEVEHDHEAWFRARVLGHRLAPWLPLWPAPPPRSSIRARFEAWRAGPTAPAIPNVA